MGHGVGEGGTGLDTVSNRVERGFEEGGGLLLGEDFEGAEDGEAGILEDGKLAGEFGEGGSGDAGRWRC